MPLSRIAGVVVLYHPDDDVIANILTYLDDLDLLIAVDNTPGPDAEFVSKLVALPNVRHLPMGANAGIAAALNAGLGACRDEGYSWALTMDQDSQAFVGMVDALRRCAGDSGPRTAVAAAVAPANRQEVGFGFTDELAVITSGSLTSVPAWESVGGFAEEFFIDQVDHEFCLRCRVRGYRIVSCREAVLLHRLGAQSTHRWFGAAVVTGNHSAERRYYMTRNTLYMADLYGREFPEWTAAEWSVRKKEFVRMMLFESDRVAKARAVYDGWRDHRRGLLGQRRTTVDARPVLARLAEAAEARS